MAKGLARKFGLLTRIKNREDALTIIETASFLVKAGICFGLISLFLSDVSDVNTRSKFLADAINDPRMGVFIFVGGSILMTAFLFICLFFFSKHQSRLASIFILLMAVVVVLWFVANVTSGNVTNTDEAARALYSLIFLWVAIRGVEATFKFHRIGRNNKPPASSGVQNA